MHRMGSRGVALLVVSVLAGVVFQAVPANAAGGTPTGGFDVRLTVGDDSALAISSFPTLPYDGRAGGALGRLTSTTPGRYDVRFDADDIHIPALALIPALGAGSPAIEILPRSIEGTLDVCTGEVALAFDATFRPRFAPRSAVQVTTEISTSTTTAAGRTATGSPLDDRGDLRLAGVALVPRTGDLLTDLMLRLPAPAVADLEAHIDFPSPGPDRSCPGAVPDTTASMDVRPGSQLLISRFPAFPYDGKGSFGRGTTTPTSDPAVFEVNFPPDQLRVPPLQFIPGSDAIRVEIIPRSIGGTANVCTGEVRFAFDAVFQPVVGTFRPSAISVVTDLTSETSSGFFQTVAGRRLDAWGDSHLVGVAQVPKTGDILVDLLLSLPTDAVADLEVHLDLPPCA